MLLFLNKIYHMTLTTTITSEQLSEQFPWRCKAISLFIEKANKYILRYPNNNIDIAHMKSKYWWLSVSFTTNSDRLYDMVYELEEATYYICEDCWKPWILRDDLFWISTLCDKCYKKHLKKSLAIKKKNNTM